MLFEHNRISKVCYECTDTGAFYVGRSWSQRGNIARYNTFDTIRPTERLAQKSCSQNVRSSSSARSRSPHLYLYGAMPPSW